MAWPLHDYRSGRFPFERYSRFPISILVVMEHLIFLLKAFHRILSGTACQGVHIHLIGYVVDHSHNDPFKFWTVNPKITPNQIPVATIFTVLRSIKILFQCIMQIFCFDRNSKPV